MAKALRGKLKKADFGYSLPLDQPLFHPPPVYYKVSTILTYSYLTDPAAAAAVLPAQLKLTDPPTVRMIFATYGWSSIGFYNEVAQSLVCTYKNTVYTYPVRLHVTSDRAMAAGREIGGFPKKIGRIEFDSGAEYLSYLDSPAGLRVCSGVMLPGKKLKDTDREVDALKYISLRIMPNPTDPENPSICELLESVWRLGPGEMWSGVGSVHLNGTSDLDPYHKLPVVKLLNSAIYRGDMDISEMRLLKKF